MSTLSQITQNSIDILDQLEGFLYTHVIKDGEENEITFGDIDFSIFKKPSDLITTALFLKEKGLDFSVTFDLLNHRPIEYVSVDIPSKNDVVLGYIKGPNTEKIREKILQIKNGLGAKIIPLLESTGITIIEIIRDETEQKKITIYINSNYENQKDFNRGKNWGQLYQLAKEKIIPYEKNFFDYFNSNSNNPLYSKQEFIVTKILRQENQTIVPNIKIELITKKAATQRRNTA